MEFWKFCGILLYSKNFFPVFKNQGCAEEANQTIFFLFFCLKVALLTKSKIKIAFKIKYIIALALKILELKKLFQSDIWLQKYFVLKWHETNNSGNNFYFLMFFTEFSCQYGDLLCMHKKQNFCIYWIYKEIQAYEPANKATLKIA